MPWKPNWGQPEPGSVEPALTEFEKMTNEYKLTPDQYLQSCKSVPKGVRMQTRLSDVRGEQ